MGCGWRWSRRAQYKAPARYDDPIIVWTWLTQADRVRLQFAYQVRHATTAQVLVTATVDYALVGPDHAPLRMTHHPDVWARLQAALAAPPPARLTPHPKAIPGPIKV